MDSLGKKTGMDSHAPFPGDLSDPGIEPRSALQAVFLPSEPLREAALQL